MQKPSDCSVKYRCILYLWSVILQCLIKICSLASELKRSQGLVWLRNLKMSRYKFGTPHFRGNPDICPCKSGFGPPMNMVLGNLITRDFGPRIKITSDLVPPGIKPLVNLVWRTYSLKVHKKEVSQICVKNGSYHNLSLI